MEVFKKYNVGSPGRMMCYKRKFYYVLSKTEGLRVEHLLQDSDINDSNKSSFCLLGTSNLKFCNKKLKRLENSQPLRKTLIFVNQIFEY